jgi:hypothetical protein
MGSWEGHCSGTAMETVIVGVSFGQALIRLLTVPVLVLALGRVVRRIAYWSRSAGLGEDRLIDLSPFLRVGVRGAFGGWDGALGRGARGDEGPTCGKVSGAALGAHRSRSIKMGSPTDWHLGSSAIRTQANVATLGGQGGLAGWTSQAADLSCQTTTCFGGSRAEAGVPGCASE